MQQGELKYLLLVAKKRPAVPGLNPVNPTCPHFIWQSLLGVFVLFLTSAHSSSSSSSLPRFLPGALWLMRPEWAELFYLRFSVGRAWVWLFYLGSLQATDGWVSSYELQSLITFTDNQANFLKSLSNKSSARSLLLQYPRWCCAHCGSRQFYRWSLLQRV